MSCPYCTLRVSKSSGHWRAFGTMSNFEKRNLKSGHLMWPGGVTFGVIGSSFSFSFFFLGGMCQIVGWTAMANLAALRAAVFSLSAKNLRGADNLPPAVRGLKGQSQLVKGRPIHSNDCGKYSLCQLDHAQQRKSDRTLYFRHKFIF